MDDDTTVIEFDENGVCNFCKRFDEQEKIYPLNAEGREKFDELIETIKEKGKNKKYDCVAGISGGTDSTYVLYLSKELGLRPLAVHFDNGWNSETAVTNIKNTLEKLDIDLSTYVVDWEEFKDLQLSFLKASVPEVEIPTDLAIHKVLYKAAAEEGVKYIISGNSFREEGIIPTNWVYRDGKYIRSIQKMFGAKKLKTFPNLSLFDLIYYKVIKRIEKVRLLNHIPYRKVDAKKKLVAEIGWKDYSGHHHESIYTRFFMSYLAPVKFHMDRRKISYSAMVRSGNMSREEALEKMTQPILSEDEIRQDKEYIAKKFSLSIGEFEKIISQEPKTFRDYPTNYELYNYFKKLLRKLGFLSLFPEKRTSI